jgi:hypothetical protein
MMWKTGYRICLQMGQLVPQMGQLVPLHPVYMCDIVCDEDACRPEAGLYPLKPPVDLTHSLNTPGFNT